jgi:hypothetical protein
VNYGFPLTRLPGREGGVEVQLHSFLSSASSMGRFTLGNVPRYSSDKRFDRSQDWRGKGKVSYPHQDRTPNFPARSESLFRLANPVRVTKYAAEGVGCRTVFIAILKAECPHVIAFCVTSLSFAKLNNTRFSLEVKFTRWRGLDLDRALQQSWGCSLLGGGGGLWCWWRWE